MAGSSMWNGKYGEEEAARRKVYERTDKMRKSMGIESDPVSKAQTSEELNKIMDQKK